MTFQILSQNKARKYSYHPNTKNCVIISITDIESEDVRFKSNNPHIKGILHLRFNDTEIEEYGRMTEKDAKRLLEFIKAHVDEIDEIVVHCFAGVGRSAGVGAALMKIMTGNDNTVFENTRFSPNMHCYQTVINCFHTNNQFACLANAGQ